MTQRKAGHEFIRELLTKTAGKRILLLTVLSLAVLLLVNGSGAARGARTQGALLILAGVAGGFLMMAAEGSERVVEAEKFVLRYEKGNAAAVLGMTPNGPSLSLYDAEGKRRLAVGLGSSGPAFVLFDENGKLQSWLYTTKDLAGLVVQGGQPQQRTEITASATGTNLALFDANGEARIRLNLQGDEPSLRLRDAAGKARLALGVEQMGPVFACYDANEKRRAGLAVTSDGPALGLCDAEGRIRAGLAVNPAGPALVLLDPQERILFSAP